MTNEELKKMIKYMVDEIKDRRKLVRISTVIKNL